MIISLHNFKYVLLGLLAAICVWTKSDAQTPLASKPSRDRALDESRTRLKLTHSEIEILNEKKICDADGDCDVLEMGWRHCGGPAEYLIVSAQNPQARSVKSKIVEYTKLDQEINRTDPPLECTPAPTLPEARCVKNLCQPGLFKPTERFD